MLSSIEPALVNGADRPVPSEHGAEVTATKQLHKSQPDRWRAIHHEDKVAFGRPEPGGPSWSICLSSVQEWRPGAQGAAGSRLTIAQVSQSCEIMCCCWQYTPEDRPKFYHIVASLEKLSSFLRTEISVLVKTPLVMLRGIGR